MRHLHFCGKCGVIAFTGTWGVGQVRQLATRGGSVRSEIVCKSEGRKTPFCRQCSPEQWRRTGFLPQPLLSRMGVAFTDQVRETNLCDAFIDHLEQPAPGAECNVCNLGYQMAGPPSRPTIRCNNCGSLPQKVEGHCAFCPKQVPMTSRLGRPMCKSCRKSFPCGCNGCAETIGVDPRREFWRLANQQERDGLPINVPWIMT